MPNPTTDRATRLELHVFGGSTGESILIRLPEDRWGLVDCYAASNEDHYVLDFLRTREVKRLEFVCLTHPHEDHYRGLLNVLQGLDVRLFWRFPGVSHKELERIARIVHYEAARDGVKVPRDMELGHILLEGRKRTEAHCDSKKLLYPCPARLGFDASEEVGIWSLAPTGNRIDSYYDQLSRCFDGDQLRKDRVHMSHNEISSALLLKFGETRIILGGDVEKASWTETLGLHKDDITAVSAVKVSHHGSVTGYCEGLWKSFSGENEPEGFGKNKPVAIVTAFQRHSLPSKMALQHIRPYASEILGTCVSPLETELEVGEQEDLESSIFMRQAFNAYSEDRKCGRCSLAFDKNGNYEVLELVAPAGRFA